jgi:hypothetical protein
MLSQLLNQMDEYLSNRPFKRRWWSKGWKSYMSIHPPLSKEAPLWKRSIEELRSLRLFDLTPEELSRIIEAYWKMPRWRRWFSYFGMNKKIDVWNYYQRCAAYQAVRPDHLEPSSVSSENKSFFNELALCLYQANVKLETYLEQRCRDPKWIEEHYSEEIESYKQRLKDTFITKLHKSLKKIKAEDEPDTLKKQAEQDYQQVEALMLDYYRQRLNNSYLYQENLIHKNAAEVIQDEEWVVIEDEVLEESLEPDRESVMVVAPSSSQTAPSSSPLLAPREIPQIDISSLRDATEWIKKQRPCLNSLIEKGSLQEVEDLLQASFDKIKALTELHVRCCETQLFEIKRKPKDYGIFLKYIDDLQKELKPLLQRGMLLFHPDHVISSTSSQAMRDLICRYSQSYIEQNRYYLNKFKNYPLRIEEFYKHSQTGFHRKYSAEWLDIIRRIEKLRKINEDLEQSLKEFDNKLNKFATQIAKNKEKLKEIEATQLQDQEKLKEIEATQLQDQEKLKEIEAKLDKLLTLSTQQSASNSSRSDENTSASSYNTGFFKP